MQSTCTRPSKLHRRSESVYGSSNHATARRKPCVALSYTQKKQMIMTWMQIATVLLSVLSSLCSCRVTPTSHKIMQTRSSVHTEKRDLHPTPHTIMQTRSSVHTEKRDLHLRGGTQETVEQQLQDFLDKITATTDRTLSGQGQIEELLPVMVKTESQVEAADSLQGEEMHLQIRASSQDDTFTVKFKRKASIKYGSAVYVTGDCPALGEDNKARAVRLGWSNTSEGYIGEDLWSTTVTGVPRNTRYRYLVKHDVKATNDVGNLEEEYFDTDYRLKHQATVVQDDTFQLVKFVINKEGAQKMHITGNLEGLGAWDLKRSIPMNKTSNGHFEKIVSIPSDKLSLFEYKFYDGKSTEKGFNRRSDAHLVEAQQEDSDAASRVVTLQSVWEGTLTRFIIYHPLDSPDMVMAISGSHKRFGSWQGSPLQMRLGKPRTLLTGVDGKCWEVTFPAEEKDIENVQYRYCIINHNGNGNNGKTAFFEREPNRVIQCMPGHHRSAHVDHPTLSFPRAGQGKLGYRQREFCIFDGNFVPPNLSFDDVPPCLAIGPYPQGQSDVNVMIAAGVTGVVNVQTDEDHKSRMVDWSLMEKLYKEAGITVVRVPIEDFNGVELAKLVKKAACAVEVLTKGMTLDAALKHVKKHRPVSAPNWYSMEQALKPSATSAPEDAGTFFSEITHTLSSSPPKSKP